MQVISFFLIIFIQNFICFPNSGIETLKKYTLKNNLQNCGGGEVE